MEARPGPLARPAAGDPRVLYPPKCPPPPGRWPGEDGGLEGPQPPGRSVGLEQLSRARARGSGGGDSPASSAADAGGDPNRGEPPPAVALREGETASLAWYRPLAAPATGGPQMPRISVPGSPTLTCEFVNFS